MKKIFLFASLLATVSSCNLDINDDPNYGNDGTVSAALIMPAVQSSIATVTGAGMYNIAGFFVQYYDQSPTGNQYSTKGGKQCEYGFKADDNISDRWYRTLYAGALADIQKIQEKTKNTADLYAAQVLRTYSFQLLVDALGETPYTEALNSSIKKPKYDDGQTVYEGVLAELDKAEENLNADDQMETNDLLLGKDINQWKGFANALRLRMYLRMIDGGINAETYTAKAKALVEAGNFFSGDVELACYTDETNKRNPWYNTYLNTADNHVAAYPLVSYLKATNDPRISYAIKKADYGDHEGEYYGMVPGSHSVAEVAKVAKKNGFYSCLNYFPTKPVEFFTQADLQFLIAEVELRFLGDDAAAQAAYEAGVKADFEARGVDGADEFLAGSEVAWGGSQADKLYKIYMQKWTALFYMDHMESWSEMRRTNVPQWSTLTAENVWNGASTYKPGELIYPWMNYLGDEKAPLRVFYSTESVNLNSNAPDPQPLTTPVFWDK